MGRFIAKVGGKYLEWSTVVDAPVTYGMRRGEFDQYYRQRYGERGMEGLQERMERVELKGTSMIPSAYDPGTLESLIVGNRAGEGETELTLEEIAEMYCSGEPNPESQSLQYPATTP